MAEKVKMWRICKNGSKWSKSGVFVDMAQNDNKCGAVVKMAQNG